MTLIEGDLLAALKALQEASLVITSGRIPTVEELDRYQRAHEWSKRVIALVERER